MFSVVIALCLGVALYFFRPMPPVVFEWLGLDHWVQSHAWFAQTSQQLPSWVLYQLPDALWAYALTVLLTKLAVGDRYSLGIYLFLALAFVNLYEASQYFATLGSFDWLDVVALNIGWILGVLYSLRSQVRAN